MSCYGYALMIKLVSYDNQYNLYTFDNTEDFRTFKIFYKNAVVVPFDKTTNQMIPTSYDLIDLRLHRHFHNHIYAV